MNPVVKPAPLGSIGFDTDMKLDADACGRLVDAGMQFAIRYLSLTAAAPRDLDASETDVIVGAGLALMLVQHVRFAGWHPSAQLGNADGTHAVQNALAASAPKGATIWCDLEGIAGTADDTMAHANAWAAAVRAGAFDPGVYVGSGVPLTAEQLFQKLTVRRYWQSASIVPVVSKRGYQMIQLYPETTVAGVVVDLDVTQSDHLGDLPTWIEGA
jgi:hypothetical protein